MPRTPPDAAPLPDRTRPVQVSDIHAVLGTPLSPPWQDGYEEATFGMGCFWGAERRMWQVAGVWSTAAGYAGGTTAHPSYADVCSGATGHAEVVRVVWDPQHVDFADLLRVFWESHDPTQGMRQGNDVGSQYRSGIWCTTDAQLTEALASREAYQRALTAAGKGAITTTVEPAAAFYFAEDNHQQYLHKNPGGYCGLGGTGVACPRPSAGSEAR